VHEFAFVFQVPLLQENEQLPLYPSAQLPPKLPDGCAVSAQLLIVEAKQPAPLINGSVLAG
jgi:hypothetical protein